MSFIAPPNVRILDVAITERPARLRLPFRFGDTLVRETFEAFVRVTIEIGGKPHIGFAAQLMVPRWFDKRPSLDNAATIAELRQAVIHAARLALESGSIHGSVATVSADLRGAVIEAMPEGTPRLAAGFGPALIEMAAIDATCRAHGLRFHEAARDDLFGIVERCPSDLSPAALRHHLGTIKPRWSIALRHTIGYDAPLTTDEILNNPDDDLPVALSDVIKATGISAFKIKLSGKPDKDIARLVDVAAVLDRTGPYRATLDANEQYDVGVFGDFLKEFKTQPNLARLRDTILFVEQPFAREQALSEELRADAFGIPLVIDESDDHDDAYVTAAENGWAGVSIKSCKGVLRALINYARVQVNSAEGRPAILTGEDLTCQPGLCWQQDTLMAAACGINHIERNGHHHAGGMRGASETERAAFLQAHPTLYRNTAAGPTLRIQNGNVDLTSLNRPGFGSIPHTAGHFGMNHQPIPLRIFRRSE